MVLAEGVISFLRELIMGLWNFFAINCFCLRFVVISLANLDIMVVLVVVVLMMSYLPC